MDSPVAFLVFNRPEHTARVFDAIRTAAPPVLFVVADGPRADVDGDVERCARVRAVVERVDWPCDVRTDFAAANLGCRQRIASGLDWIFSQADRAIILEDDCLPDPSFFPFCDELLERYASTPEVAMVAGTNVLPERMTMDSYYFSRNVHIWGWATWARAWQYYDVDMTTWPEIRAAGKLADHLPDDRMGEYATALFDATHAGLVPTWDFQWVYSMWMRDALAAVPVTNLVTNIGYGADASHERNDDHWLANLPITPMRFPLEHPLAIVAHEEADRSEWSAVVAKQGPVATPRRGGRLARALFGRRGS